MYFNNMVTTRIMYLHGNGKETLLVMGIIEWLPSKYSIVTIEKIVFRNIR